MSLWSIAATVYVLASFSKVLMMHIFVSIWTVDMSAVHVIRIMAPDLSLFTPCIGCSYFDIFNILILSETVCVQFQCYFQHGDSINLAFGKVSKYVK